MLWVEIQVLSIVTLKISTDQNGLSQLMYRSSVRGGVFATCVRPRIFLYEGQNSERNGSERQSRRCYLDASGRCTLHVWCLVPARISIHVLHLVRERFIRYTHTRREWESRENFGWKLDGVFLLKSKGYACTLCGRSTNGCILAKIIFSCSMQKSNDDLE